MLLTCGSCVFDFVAGMYRSVKCSSLHVAYLGFRTKFVMMIIVAWKLLASIILKLNLMLISF